MLLSILGAFFPGGGGVGLTRCIEIASPGLRELIGIVELYSMNPSATISARRVNKEEKNASDASLPPERARGEAQDAPPKYRLVQLPPPPFEPVPVPRPVEGPATGTSSPTKDSSSDESSAPAEKNRFLVGGGEEGCAGSGSRSSMSAEGARKSVESDMAWGGREQPLRVQTGQDLFWLLFLDAGFLTTCTPCLFTKIVIPSKDTASYELF